MSTPSRLLTKAEIQGPQYTWKDSSVFGNAQPANKAFSEALGHEYVTFAGLNLVHSALLDVVGLAGKIVLPFFHAVQGKGSQVAVDLTNLSISIIRAPVALGAGFAATTVGLIFDPMRISAENIRQSVVPGHRALTIIDTQNDFMPPKGSLAVKNGDKIVKPINELEKSIHAAGEYVAMTEDFHPRGHGSFASSHPNGQAFTLGTLNGVPQVRWPDHCIQGTRGVLVHKGITDNVDVRVRKGQKRLVDSYSGLYDNDQRNLSGFFGWIRSWLHVRSGATGLLGWFKDRDVRELDVVGLATDYCVKFTAIDALAAGMKVNVILDACRGVGEGMPGADPKNNSTTQAVEELRRLGARIMTVAQAKAEYAKIKANKAATAAA